MAINEVFPNPTVKQVIFQIKYPNLFYLENKIGEFQLLIMEEFPESALTYRQQMVFADFGPDAKVNIPEPQKGNKIWGFQSRQKVDLHILSNSLDLTSQFHKTYMNKGAEYKFRDTIKFVLDIFLKIVGIPIITRIGLRYIDECPLPETLTTVGYRDFYNTTLPLDRFPIEAAQNLQFQTQVRREKHYFRFSENFSFEQEKPNLIMDFDTFSLNIKPSEYLSITDELHTIISKEYEQTLKKPVFDIMRTQKR